MKKLLIILSVFVLTLVSCTTYYKATESEFKGTIGNHDDNLALAFLPLAFVPPVSIKLPKLSDKQKLKNVVVKQKDVFASLLDYPDTCNFHSDIWLLSNLNRLKVANPTEFANMLNERFASRPSSDPFAGMSDEDKFKFIKSKNIQTPSELDAWLDFLDRQEAHYKDVVSRSAKEVTSLVDSSVSNNDDV